MESEGEVRAHIGPGTRVITPAGVDRTTPDPAGVLVDSAMSLIEAKMPSEPA